MKQSNSINSRQKLLLILKKEGPKSSKNLAKELGLSIMAVSLHLRSMHKQDEINFKVEFQSRGRPIKIWHLTEKTNHCFPNSYSEFSLGLISAINETFGDKAMGRLLDILSKNNINKYEKSLHNTTLEEQLHELAAVRTEDGYMAHAEKTEGENEFLFIENNCPIKDAAQACSAICKKELEIFNATLGKAIKAERLEHILQGARRCVYKITAL